MKSKITSLFVFAHPDDEILGASQLIDLHKDGAHIAFTTNGMTNPITDPDYYPPYTEFPPYGETYAKMRKEEALNALGKLCIPPNRIYLSPVDDGEILYNINTTRTFILNLIKKTQPAHVFTHAYEGGHIDHDLTSFIVNSCINKTHELLTEFFLYNMENGIIQHNKPLVSSQFKSQKPTKELIKLKKMALLEYPSQTIDIQYFDLESPECYTEWGSSHPSLTRFSSPPHPGPLLYEANTSNLTFKNLQTIVKSYLKSYEI